MCNASYLGLRAQRSLFLSPVPTQRRKKGTKKLAPITCAHSVAGGFQQKRTAPPDVDAAETMKFSWKVVVPQEQREHDVRVSQAMQAWLLNTEFSTLRGNFATWEVRPEYDILLNESRYS